jgi:hypothetical protein
LWADTSTTGVYPNLVDLNDVSITSLANNNLLVYNTSSGKWVNSATLSGLSLVSPTITGTGSITATTFTGALTGNASTATTLATARAINGVNFDGSAAITVTAAAGTLTGSTLASGVTASSLTSLGTLSSLLNAGAGISTTTATFTSGKTVITGTALATAAQGAFESDASNILYTTGNTSTGGGRQVVNAAIFNVLGAGGTVASGGAFFPSANPYLQANHYYRFRYFVRFTKNTAGTISLSFTNSGGGNMTIIANALLATAAGAGISNLTITANAAASTTTTASSSLVDTTSYVLDIRGSVMVATAGRLSLLITDSAGTITSVLGSNYDFVDMGTASTGNVG